MTLQTSGAISLSQVQSEFGGGNPISMSEYYRGGSYVPTSVTQAAGSWTSYYGNSSYTVDEAIFSVWKWNGTTISGEFTGGGTTSLNVGGYNYQRGTQWGSFTSGSGKSATTTTRYRIRRRLAASTITVNTNVPSSGTIDMADFYGGRNS